MSFGTIPTKPVPWHTQIHQLHDAQEALAKRLADSEDAMVHLWAKHLCEQVKGAPDQYELHIKRFQDEVVYSFERKDKGFVSTIVGHDGEGNEVMHHGV